MQDKKRVLITGANGGIGKALYKEFAFDPNFESIVHIKCEDSLEELEKIKPVQKNSIIIADFSNLQNLQTVLSQNDLDIDILINNAGYYESGYFVEQPFKRILKQININYLSALMFTHHFSARMRKNNIQGHIINISSGSGIHGGMLPSFGYASAKNSLNFMTKILADELEVAGIKINTVIVRFVNTKMLTKFARGYQEFYKKKFIPPINVLSAKKVAESIINIINNDLIKSGETIELK